MTSSCAGCGTAAERRSGSWVVAFTSTSARETSFRPPVQIRDRRTLVMCDQMAAVDLNRLAEPAGFLTVDEMQRVDAALSLVLDL